MEKLIELLSESAQNAFFLGTLLYGMCFAGQAIFGHQLGGTESRDRADGNRRATGHTLQTAQGHAG